jgi:alkyldihydroxyacetonephosphate synthase
MSAPHRLRPPIELTGTDQHLDVERVDIDDDLLAQLREICEVITDVEATAEASRDWWPIALHWSLAGQVPSRAAAVVRPTSTEQIATILRRCAHLGIPVTAAGGRSGVSGASVPLHGGVLLDISALSGIVGVDPISGIVEVLAGTFGPDLEDALASQHGLSVGHFPQSFELATVGGWVACRGAGQYSTRYGKIEDMVVALEVVLADGTEVRTGIGPAASTGPDLKHLFIGSEGTLGVITRVWLRTHPKPESEQRAAYWFSSFDDGLEACRRILRSGATPAVLRLYDEAETHRSHRGDEDRGDQDRGDRHRCALLVLDEAHPLLLAASMAVVDEVCSTLGERAPVDLVDRWFQHRNDTSALQSLTRRGFVVDTMEIAAPWTHLSAIRAAVGEALHSLAEMRNVSCHLSHSYRDGACLYFSLAAAPAPDRIDETYRQMWDLAQRAALSAGANLAHHHGVGLNRGRFMAESLGTGHDVLAQIKHALDPHAILNPGKLGLRHRGGPEAW